MITGIHHISAYVKSARINHDFYVNALGLRFVKNTVNQQNTTVRHLFYGDYQANPGTQLTFFELKDSGRSYSEDNYFSTITLSIPKSSISYWQNRLAEYGVKVEQSFDQDTLFFKDPDGVPLSLRETDEVMAAENATRHSSVPKEKQIIGINEVLIRVADPEATLNFFSSFLGLKRDGSCNYIYNEANGFRTTIEASNNTNKTRLGHGGIDHIAYMVDSSEELKQLHQKALDMNLPVEMYVNRDYFESLYVIDPNGLRIEIATRGPGFTIDEPLETLGEKFSLPDFLENKRAEIEAQLEEF